MLSLRLLMGQTLSGDGPLAREVTQAITGHECCYGTLDRSESQFISAVGIVVTIVQMEKLSRGGGAIPAPKVTELLSGGGSGLSVCLRSTSPLVPQDRENTVMSFLWDHEKMMCHQVDFPGN